MAELIPVEAWQDPVHPVKGANPTPWLETAWVLHHAGINEDVAPEDTAGWLLSTDKYYRDVRGYSLGYNYAVNNVDGSLWEIRGKNWKNAANVGEKVEGNFNSQSRSVLVLAAADAPASSVAVGTLREFLATEPAYLILGHRDVEWTACPIDHIYAQFEAGVFAVPPPPPPTEDETMDYIAIPAYPGHDADSEWWCVYSSGAVRRAVNSDVTFAASRNIPQIPQTSKEHDEYLRSIAP